MIASTASVVPTTMRGCIASQSVERRHVAERARLALPHQHEHDEVDRRDDREHRQAEQDDEAPRRAARLVLTFEEVHGCPRVESGQGPFDDARQEA